ncbi:MAG: alpha/beta fold hydrolase, partial [Bacteroidia bacterium]
MILFCRHYGNHPQTLIVLHGLFGQSDNWTSLARRWSDMFTVITPDQRNHGQSPQSDDFNYSLMADDLKETVDALGIRSFALLGHSMG